MEKTIQIYARVMYLKSFPKYIFDISQAAKQHGVDGPQGAKAKGGPGSRAVERTRQSDDEDDAPRPLGLKAAKKIAREEAEVAEVKARNVRAIRFEQEKFTERAALHRQTIEADQARAAADLETASVARDTEDNLVMRMDLEHLPLKRQKYWEDVQEEIEERRALRRVQRLAAAEAATFAAVELAAAAEVARVFALSPAGIAAARAAEEAADAADADRAAAMVAAAAATLAAAEAESLEAAHRAALAAATARRLEEEGGRSTQVPARAAVVAEGGGGGEEGGEAEEEGGFDDAEERAEYCDLLDKLASQMRLDETHEDARVEVDMGVETEEDEDMETEDSPDTEAPTERQTVPPPDLDSPERVLATPLQTPRRRTPSRPAPSRPVRSLPLN